MQAAFYSVYKQGTEVSGSSVPQPGHIQCPRCLYFRKLWVLSKEKTGRDWRESSDGEDDLHLLSHPRTQQKRCDGKQTQNTNTFKK